MKSDFRYRRWPDKGEEGNFEFASEEEYRNWRTRRDIQLAELAQVLNYNERFERTKGQDGHYAYKGDKFKVKGTWDVYTVWSDWPATKAFKEWLISKGLTEDTWFVLKDKYKKVLDEQAN